MPEPGGSPGLVDIARRWAERLADMQGVDLPRAELEGVLTAVAEEASAQAAAAREAAAARFAVLYAASPHGVVLADPEGRILDVNDALARLLGYEPGELAGQSVTGLGAGDGDVEAIRDVLAALPAERPQHREGVDLEHAAEGPVRTHLTVTSVPGDNPDKDYPILIVQDISELNLLHETLRRQNTQDPLTGLPNAGAFDHQLEATLAAGERLALVYFDIDGFKVVNDGLNRDAGDKVLRHAAKKLQEIFAEHDGFVARLTGDGFAVLITGSPTRPTVVALVEEAMAELAEPVYVADDKGVAVGMSAGIVVLDADGYTADDLHRAAEITLHRAKESGRAQWMLFEPELDEQDRRRYGLGAELGGALENGQFEVEYAPTVKLDGSNQIAVVNAVLRWNHPEHGRLRAEEFYPLADTTGMTLSLGRWLLTDALREASTWERDFTMAPDVCVRLPRRLAIDPNLVGIVRDLLEDTGLPPRKLRICTDTLTVLDPRGEVAESLAVLSQLDVKVALAVSGAADLELLHKHGLPVGFVILSGPLVDAVASDGPEATTALKHLGTLLSRANDLGLTRIGAEGVNTPEHARRLRELGIVAGRGKLFGNTATADEIKVLIKDGLKNTS